MSPYCPIHPAVIPSPDVVIVYTYYNALRTYFKLNIVCLFEHVKFMEVLYNSHVVYYTIGQVFNAKLYVSSLQYTSIFIQCLRTSNYQVLITIIINVVVEYFLITMVLNYIVGQIILHESV